MIKILSSKALSLVITGFTLLASTGGAVKLSNEVASYKPTVPEVKQFSPSKESVEPLDADKIDPTDAVDTAPNTPITNTYKNPVVAPTPAFATKITTSRDNYNNDEVWESHKVEMEKEWESAKEDSDDEDQDSGDANDDRESDEDSEDHESKPSSEKDADNEQKEDETEHTSIKEVEQD